VSTGKELIKALIKFPDIISRDTYPSSVYSFLNLHNFQFAIKYWLGYALEDKQYDVSVIDYNLLHNWYFLDYMFDQPRNQSKNSPRSTNISSRYPSTPKRHWFFLKVIFQQTLDFSQLKKKIPKHIFQNWQVGIIFCNLLLFNCFNRDWIHLAKTATIYQRKNNAFCWFFQSGWSISDWVWCFSSSYRPSTRTITGILNL